MANPTVEKLKVFGLRHGEKIVVGLASATCLLLLVTAFRHPVIQLTPDEVKKAAEAANSNINRPQTKDSIIARLDEEFKLKGPDFVAEVDAQKPGSIDPTLFAFNGPAFVSPEPGAGLIRELPQLIAPTELLASTGRGSISVFKRDENGDFVYPVEETTKKKSTSKRGRGRQPGMPGMPGMMTGGATGKAKSKREQEEEFAKQQKEVARKRALLAGTAEDEPEEEAEVDTRMPDFEKKGYRWVALVGVIDHRKLVQNFTRALKDSNAAPHYLRLDIQRQILGDDGNWGDRWVSVDHKKTDEILGEIQSVEEEWTPENVRLDELVDPLPFLEVGSWRGVHVASLVPAEKRNIPDAKKEDVSKGAPGLGGMAGMPPGMGMNQSYSASSTMSGGIMPGTGAPTMMMPGAPGTSSSDEDTKFARTDAEKIMLRALDFMVDPDASYRYRVRLVVRNPNLNHEDVAAGVDTTTEELFGPWSEPCEPVTVPADVTTYALKPVPGAKNADSVTFQVVKWNEADGLTIVRNFDQKPGDIIGALSNASVPAPDGKKDLVSRPIDFNSRQLLIDTSGGTLPVPGFGAGNNARLEVPAQALVIRSDGLLVLRDQARDTTNPDAKRLKDIYEQIKKEATEGKPKKKKTSRRNTGGMMGGMGGMMGGGMR
jgi:hypothetical protein